MAETEEDVAAEPGGEDAAAGGGEQQQESFIKRFFSGSIVKILSYVVAVIAIILISVTASYFVVGSKSETPLVTEDEDHTVSPKIPPLAAFPINDLRLNTADKEPPHYIRISITLAYENETGNAELRGELDARKSQITDIIIHELTKYKYEDWLEPENKERIKNIILLNVNSILINQKKVKAVYFSELTLS